MKHTGNRLPRRGFTLVETALAVVIVGTGVLAMVLVQETVHRQNRWGERAARAARLGNEIRERCFNLAPWDPVTGTAWWGLEPGETIVADFDDIDDFDGCVFEGATGPIDGGGNVIPDMDGWRQEVTVEPVDPGDLSVVVPAGATDVLRVRVDVSAPPGPGEAPELVTSVTWVQSW
ncbi:MAG: prepilin-type N-terminal cleavage/methylation domain-containing protein [Phycisphaerales bacterium]|nr:prepilin-type N-terminal cleavage/methylation domain-containing protein [Phycisphaerales bacterium]MCH2149643.1 prepilin-type N-terminal cleavage/methylation domain-containing protein [Phycisphaerales bacterium]